jgi:DnaJ domain
MWLPSRLYSGFGEEVSGVLADGERARGPRFHGRIDSGESCAEPGCTAPGEFRAPVEDGRRPGFDGPGDWRWLCLDHVRAFNTRYNFFEGMSADEIEDAQRPYAGWERETRAFASAGDRPPRWADFADPLEAVSGRFGRRDRDAPRADGKPLSEGDRKALGVLGLGKDADRRALRTRYAELVRRYHPDRNGGDRSHEKALQAVIEAYTLLRRAPAFA